MDGTKREALLSAVEAGSITAAAEKMGYTQSGLSYTIAALEAEVGFPLLHRSRGGVQPTAECRRLLPLLQDLRRREALLEQETADIRGTVVGTLCLATFPSVARLWLLPLLVEFETLCPGVTVNLQEYGQAECLRQLRSGQADMAFFSRQPGDGLEWENLRRIGILAVLPESHPLAESAELPLDSLADEWFIMPTAESDSDVCAILEAASFTPRVRFRSRDELTILAMVREGLGVGIMSENWLRNPVPGVAVRPLVPRAYWQFGAACPCRKELSPAGRRFWELVRHRLGAGAAESR